ncbi:MAG: FliA/WhiG family RNA polymerase sigma factor [bacterium]|jgi:RNA polymerase sigma factor for flagellar operon FliA|nr:FliA/WhiG family RNA polymerase sigma factor [bacterium]MBK7045997.1 FliA/WhiG family RNA polymerase sigma factor [bacterium]MBK7189283.1 FliA/WhiG family RNA polymerase sigma factor [bacterium]MBK7671630.1 FliA/WhiG family RNA polymerase sigma factor [bacterium]MBK7770692.1 FliA/WhiG family RNA polymerase sigma factor [bacterium]
MTETVVIPIPHLDLWRHYRRENCQDARRDLVDLHARIVKYVAGRMAIGLPHYVEFNDLISAGLLGLLQAIDNFDPERGIKFETYAIPRIRGAILDELRSQDWFPRSLRRKAKMLEEAYGTLEVQLGRPATDAEVAKRLSIDISELDGMLGEVAVATIVSLDADTSGDDSENSTSLGDYLADSRTEDIEKVIARQEMKELIGSRMAELPEKEQLVLVLYYYEELTLKEIGEILDVTESRVCQIHTRAIMRLKGKIDRHEGKSSIGQITRQIRRRQEETDRQDELEPTPTNVKAVRREFEPVNVMACLSLFQLTSCLTWLARSGNWPG